MYSYEDRVRAVELYPKHGAQLAEADRCRRAEVSKARQPERR